MKDRHRGVAAAGALAIAILAVGCSAPTPSVRNPAALDEGQPYSPVVDPANFRDPIANDYFPLDPGLVTIFEGGDEHVEVTVTDDTKVIMGVTTHVVTDQVFVAGELQEDTIDWYAADNFGNVWYFGEQTAEYENGKVTSTAGSWEAGVDGAQPGIVMLADPEAGDRYRQEFYAGEAEDLAEVTAVTGSVKTPAGSWSGSDVLVTEEWTLLEPDVRERKTYVRGVGVVEIRTIKGGKELTTLTEAKFPAP